MGSVVAFLAYSEAPNSILIKNPKIGRIILDFPYFPYYPCLGSLGLLSSIFAIHNIPGLVPQTMLALRGSTGVAQRELWFVIGSVHEDYH